MKSLPKLCCAAAFFLVACASSTPDINQRKADILLQGGIEALQEGDPTQALRSLQEAARYSPKSPNIWNNIGVAFVNKDDFARAEESWKKALQIDPGFHDARLNLGALYVRQRKFREAEFQLKEAGKDPSYLNLYQVAYNMAQLYLVQGKKLQAEQQLKISVRERQGYCPAWFQLGVLQKERGEFHQAALSLKNSVAGVCFKNPAAHYEIASLYLKAQEFKNARTKFLEIIQLFPESDWAKKAAVSLNEIR